eukprot:gene31107-6238_t
MAIGKNKRLTKGKKGGKKKAVDPFTKKDWYDVKAPTIFTVRSIGKTLVTRTTGTKNEEDSYRKIRLKLRSMVRKWQSLIEAYVDVKTTDGYTLRVFCLAFTKKRPGQVKRTCYAQSGQIRMIRKKMTDIMARECSSVDLKDLVAKFIPEAIGKDIEKACQGIYPLQNVCIRKCKILKAPKFDLLKLMEVHGDYTEEAGSKIERSAPIVGEEPVAEE